MEQLLVTKIPQYHPLTMRIISLLEQKDVGATVTDDELKEIIGFSTAPNEKGYGYLQSAIRYVLRSKGKVWQRSHGSGRVECLGSADIVKTVDCHITKLRREAKRATHKASVVDRTKLDHDQTRHLNAQTALCGTISLMTRSDAIKKIELDNVRQPDTNKVLALFPAA